MKKNKCDKRHCIWSDQSPLEDKGCDDLREKIKCGSLWARVLNEEIIHRRLTRHQQAVRPLWILFC